MECINYFRTADNSYAKFFYFSFQMDSLTEIINGGNGISKFPYYLTEEKYFFIYVPNLDEDINIIYLNSADIFYSKNDYDKIIQPIYEYLNFKLYFDKYFINPGKFFSLDKSENDIELDDKTLYNIDQIKGLRYNITESEKIKKGTHLKLKIRIFDNNNKPLTDIEEFNFFVCLEGYQITDLDSSMKCLNEGYYNSSNLSFSCYETCKTCDTYKKPSNANYYNNYCDSCKLNYPYFINIKGENNNFYKSCYEQCPEHAPYLKDNKSKECVSQCPKYKTIDGKCVKNCDYEFYKYLLKSESICYNYIPNNYFTYIDNYNDIYENSDKPIIKIMDKCPDDSYDSSFKNFCIKSEQDIYYFIPNPNELIGYNNPLIISLKTKNIIIRAYTSDLKSDDLKKYDNKLFKIDISPCEKILKKVYNIGKEESFIIYDVNNLDNENYIYKIFTTKGEELDLNICSQKNITLNKINYYVQKELNSSLCPLEYPYYEIKSNKCLKYCDIIHFLDKICVTDYINKENKEYNINNIKSSIQSHLIDDLLNNLTKGGEDIIIKEKGIKYHISTTSNQNNKIYENISNINLGKCENVLKKEYDINLNDSLLIFKVDVDVEGYSTTFVEYEIYHPITKKKLDLNFCKEEKIIISTLVNINEKEVAKYNPKSDFYNDICSTHTSKFNTDMTLKDRQNEFINNNMTLCEDDCDFNFSLSILISYKSLILNFTSHSQFTFFIEKL